MNLSDLRAPFHTQSQEQRLAAVTRIREARHERRAGRLDKKLRKQLESLSPTAAREVLKILGEAP